MPLDWLPWQGPGQPAPILSLSCEKQKQERLPTEFKWSAFWPQIDLGQVIEPLFPIYKNENNDSNLATLV